MKGAEGMAQPPLPITSTRPEVLWRYLGYGAHPGSEPCCPKTLPVIPENVPQELKARDQWVAWDWAWADSKWDSAPIDPRTGDLASEDDSSTWVSFTEAIAYAVRQLLPGVGFVLADADPFVVIRIDECRAPGTGMVRTKAKNLISVFNSYAEISETGRGVHVVVAGHLPTAAQDSSSWPEICISRRFVPVTGHRFDGTSNHVRARQSVLDRLHDDRLARRLGYGKLDEPVYSWSRSTALSMLHASPTGVIIADWHAMFRNLAIEDGTERWHSWFGDNLPDTCIGGLESIAHGDWLEVIGDWNDGVLLNTATGKQMPLLPSSYVLGVRDAAIVVEPVDAGAVAAIDVGTGERRWVFPCTGPTYFDGTQQLVFGVQQQSVVALNIGDGHEQWRVDLTGGIVPEASLVGNLAIVADVLCATYSLNDQTVICGLNAATGRFLWQFNGLYPEIWREVDDLLLVHPEGDRTRLCAIDPRLPDMRWQIDNLRRILSVQAESHLLKIATETRPFVIIDTRSGQEYPLPPDLPLEHVKVTKWRSLLLAQDVQSSQRHFRVYDADTGVLRWKCANQVQPAVTDGMAYVASSGAIRAFDLLTGAELWAEPIGEVGAATTRSDDVARIRELRVIGSTLLVMTGQALTALRLPSLPTR